MNFQCTKPAPFGLNHRDRSKVGEESGSFHKKDSLLQVPPQRGPHNSNLKHLKVVETEEPAVGAVHKHMSTYPFNNKQDLKSQPKFVTKCSIGITEGQAGTNSAEIWCKL